MVSRDRRRRRRRRKKKITIRWEIFHQSKQLSPRDLLDLIT
jgi:hypothetical protein